MLADAGRAEADRPERGNEAATNVPGVADVLRVLQEEAGLNVEVSVEEAGDTVEVEVDGPDEAFLTAGPVAEALELLLQRAASREAAAPRRVFLGGTAARRRREEELEALARGLAQRARQERRPQHAPPLNSYERRLVHMLLADEPGVRTRSEGEGRERRLLVEPREDPSGEPDGSSGAA
jgi:spoIIIJ-associated protein